MKLYEHVTDGGAIYYSTTFIEAPDGTREATLDGLVLRTDGDEIEIYTTNIWRQGYKIKLVGDFEALKREYFPQAYNTETPDAPNKTNSD